MSDNCNDIVKEKANGGIGNIKTSNVNIYDGQSLSALPSITPNTSSLNDVIAAINDALVDINTAISNISLNTDSITYSGSYSACITLNNGDSVTDVLDQLAGEICSLQTLITGYGDAGGITTGIGMPCWTAAPGPYTSQEDFNAAVSNAICSLINDVINIQDDYATNGDLNDTADAAFDNFISQGFLSGTIGLVATIGPGTSVTKGELKDFLGSSVVLTANSDNHVYYDAVLNSLGNNVTAISGTPPALTSRQQPLYKYTTGVASVSATTDQRNFSIMRADNVKTDRIKDGAVTGVKMEDFGTAGTYLFPSSIVVDAKGRVQSISSSFNIVGATNNDVLYYDSGTSKWINGSIYDVLGYGVAGQYAKYNITGELISSAILLTDISEFSTLGSPFNRAVVMYDTVASGYVNKNFFKRTLFTVSGLATTADRVIGVDTTGGVVTITLPSPTTQLEGDLIIIKDEANSFATNRCDVVASGGALVGGMTTYTMATNGESIILYSDGNNYQKL